MEFRIFIRNAVTGEEQNFADKQAIADFLALRADAADWEGYQNLGELPPAILTGEPTAEAPVEAETPAETPATPPDTAPETPETPPSPVEAAPQAPAETPEAA